MIKNYLYFALLFVSIFASRANAQCTWTNYAFESFEYTTVVPGIIPLTTYQDVPTTDADHAGTYGLYLNFVNGFTGMAYDQEYTVCAGQNYRFSFWTRDAFTSSNNLTFQVVDAANVVISTQNVINNGVWQNITMPAFTPATPTIRFRIITNTAGGPGNDAAVDEIRLQVCAPNPVAITKAVCAGVSPFDLFDDLSTTTQSGIWTGPSALTNGHQGTFTPSSNTAGTYTYTIDGGLTCPDSVFTVQMQVFATPTLNAQSDISICGNYTLPGITGSNLSGNEHYYTGPNGTGTILATGSAVTSSQTIYVYDGAPGCSDEESFDVTITPPHDAGEDNIISFCSAGAAVNMNSYNSFTATPGGTWAETSVPASGTFNPATADWPTAGVAPGTYTFTYTFLQNGPCIFDQATITVDLGTLSVNLGNDTSFCQGSNMQLSPGVYDTYLWDNGSINPTRFVSQPGTYYVKVGQTGENLIVNGDFEQGNTGFTTQYTIGTSTNISGLLFVEGTYLILSNPHDGHTGFGNYPDHTPGIGTQMMVVNGAGTPNKKVWCQNVTVDPNTQYNFSTYVANALNDATVANLQFSINGVTLGSIFSPSAVGGVWEQVYRIWNSTVETTAEICIVNQNTSTGGNDFLLDDISFAPICYASDTIVVGTYPKPVITISPNDTICAGEIGTLTASSVTPNLTYNWNPGSLTTATINVSPATTTVYSATGTSPQGCVSSIVTKTIVVRPTPVASVFINGGNPVCNGTETILNGSSSIGGVSYLWSTGATTPTITVTATVPSSDYTLTVTTGNGCADDSTVTIAVYPDLDVDIAGVTAFCEGYSTTLTAIGNLPGMDFVWSENAQTTEQIEVNHGGWIYVTGDFAQCPQAKDSIQLTVNQNPVVIVPGDYEVCPGESVVATVSSNLPGSTFVWSPGNLTGTFNTITTDGTTTYTVIAQNGDCVSEPQQFSIFANAACFLVVPNVFTPNGDDENDFFQLVNSQGLNSLKCVIINRWGETVATFDTPQFKWDGKDRSGNELTEGVYFYVIDAVTKGDEELHETGNITLVRAK